MTTFSRIHLSGSTDGAPIPVAATATPGTLLHTSVAGTSSFDEVTLYVSNVTASPATITIEWGSVTDPGGLICKAYSVAANSAPTIVVNALPMNNAKLVRAFSGTASALNITGFVTRIV